MTIEEQFDVYRMAKGDCISRLRAAGYALGTLKEDEIGSLDDFRRVVGRDDCMGRETLRSVLRKVFGNRISAAELRKFLMADVKFGEANVLEALRMIPSDEDGSITVEAFIEFLYK